MAETSTVTRRSSLMTPLHWSQLPEELLNVISTKLNNCFDVVHARSVCRSWRSSFPFPCCLLRPAYSLPAFSGFPSVSKDLCNLEKVPMFLFRVKTPPATSAASEYFLGRIGRDMLEEQLEIPSPLQCSVKVKTPTFDPTVIKTLDCQIFPLGHHYRMIGWDPQKWSTKYRGVAFLPLNEGRDFVVLISFTGVLFMLRSAEMRWMPLLKFTDTIFTGLVAFRGRFYVVFLYEIFTIDPYSLTLTLLPPSPLLWRSHKYLIRSGDDELFLVEKYNPYPDANVDLSECRVSRLDEEAFKWVVVNDLGDRVFFIGHFGNVCCSAKELPGDCGLSGNSIVFSNFGNVTFAYKYGVRTGRVEEELNCWRFARENRVRIISSTPGESEGLAPVVALQVER